MCVHVHICNFVRLLLLLILSCLLWRFNPLCFIVAHVLLLWQKKKYLTILLKQNHQSYVRTIPVHFPLLMITLKWSYIIQSWKNRRQQIFCCLFPQALFHTRHTLCFFCMLTIHTKNMYWMYVYYVYIILRIFCCHIERSTILQSILKKNFINILNYFLLPFILHNSNSWKQALPLYHHHHHYDFIPQSLLLYVLSVPRL